MHQRPNVTFPKAPANSNKSELALFMVNYMLQSGNSEIPIMFLSKEDIGQTVSEAYAGNASISDEITEVDIEPSDVDPIGAMATLTVMALSKPVGCILTFENGNSLCVVGSGSSFYMIDLSNGIFCNTSGPEYDIGTYVEEYGSNDCKLQYFTLQGEKEPVKPTKAKRPRKKEEEGTAEKKKRTTKPVEIKNEQAE